MDKLLMQNPKQLNDERRELFALIDRFAKSIKIYQDEYAALEKKSVDDLAMCKQEMTQKLKALSENQNSEKSALEKNHSINLRKLNERLNNIKSSASQYLNELEKQCETNINREQSMYNEQLNYDNDKINTYKGVLDEISKLIRRADSIMGNTITGASKFKKVCKDVKVNSVIIKDSKTAAYYVSKNTLKKTQDLLATIREITESLPKKIVFNGKINDAVKELLEIQANAENAFKMLENSICSGQASAKKIFEQRIKSHRDANNKNKQAVIEKRDNDIKRLHAEITQENNEYNNRFRNLNAVHKQDYDHVKKHQENQISDAVNRWKREKQKLNDKFSKHMDSEYPGDRMNAWINQFWYHPRKVEDYKMICDKLNLNVLLGIAQIDISDWVSGLTGGNVKSVLTNYITLFGRNREQANQSFANNIILLPYTISLENGDSVLLSHDEASGERANAMLNGIAMRLLNSVPAGMMRFILFDEVGYGSFKELKSIDPAEFNTQTMMVKSIISGEGKSESQMSSLLADLDSSFARIEGRTSNYLSLREFNNDNPLSKKEYQPLLMANYPSGLKVEGLKTLNKIVSNCSKWGGTVFMAQPDNLVKSLKPEVMAVKNELDKKIITLRLETGRNELTILNAESDSEKRARIRFFKLPDKDVRMKDIAPNLRKRSVEASKVKIMLTDADDIFLPKEMWFKGNSDYGISVPIGYEDNGIPFELQFDDAHVNAMITGRIGTGKSNLVHALIMGMLMRYDPSEVKIYLIDFKNATDYNVYAKRHYLPSFAAISLADDPEIALSILESIDKEVKIRSGVLSDSDTKKIGNSTSRKLCRILLIIDELYVLAEKAQDELRKKIMDMIDTLTHQTRAYGIHIIVCGQDLNKLEHYDTIMEQCTTRIALHCSEEQVRELLGDSGVSTMHSIDSDDRGVAVFSSDGGKTSGKERTVLVEDSKQLQILNDISDYYLAQDRLDRTIIVHSKIKDNPNNPLQLFVTHGKPQYNGICIGEPIILGGSNFINPEGHVWVAGGNITEKSYYAAQSVVFFMLYSTLLNKFVNKNVSICCSNCTDQSTRDVQDEEKDLFGQLASSYPQFFKYDRGEEINNTLALFYDEIEKRSANPERCNNPIWWFVVRPEIINNLSHTFVTDFTELLARGIKSNIHIVLWNYDVKQAQQLLQVNRNMFKERICLEMSSEDMRMVNGVDLNPVPNGYKVSIAGNNTVRFRVFDLPDGVWMNELFARLNTLVNK